MELSCVAQTYDWGKKGNASLVAQLLKSNKSFQFDENRPYAELWMGTHPSGESTVKKTGETLSEFIKKNPKSMGTSLSLAQGDLPFLFKVLSVNKALSIQAHPDKDLAKSLNKTDPTHYKDANHKPELAIAVTEFEALAGFRPMKEIQNFLKLIPEMSNLIGKAAVKAFDSNPTTEELKKIFSILMKSPPVAVKKHLEDLLKRLSQSADSVKSDHLHPLLLKLSDEHPGDIGIFAIYFFNHVKLRPGESMFINAGVPHAYLCGDCIECMACSDNVIRAGLTPKFRDVETLCSALDYTNFAAEDMKFKGEKIGATKTVFKPPVKEFAVSQITSQDNEDLLLPKLQGCSILIIIEGGGKSSELEVKPGTTLYVPAQTEIRIAVYKELLAFLAFCNE